VGASSSLTDNCIAFPHDPAFEREADASSSVLEGGCSRYEEVRAHNVLEKPCIDLCPSGSCSKNPVFHSPTTHLFSFLEANLGLSVFPSPTFIFFLFSAWVCQIYGWLVVD
jgi:hypothetical protein